LTNEGKTDMAAPSIDISRISQRSFPPDDLVTLLVFTDGNSSLSNELVSFAKSIVASNPSVEIDVQDVAEGKNEKLQALKIEYWPCLVLMKSDFTRIRYFGTPSGYETAPFMDAISELEKQETKLSEDTKKALVNIRRKANVKVFVLTTCTFCPVMARLSYRIAIESQRITAEIIDSSIFTDWAQRHLVMGVPKVILNDNTDITGAVSEEQFIEKLRDADHALIDNIYG